MVFAQELSHSLFVSLLGRFPPSRSAQLYIECAHNDARTVFGRLCLPPYPWKCVSPTCLVFLVIELDSVIQVARRLPSCKFDATIVLLNHWSFGKCFFPKRIRVPDWFTTPCMQDNPPGKVVSAVHDRSIYCGHFALLGI